MLSIIFLCTYLSRTSTVPKKGTWRKTEQGIDFNKAFFYTELIHSLKAKFFLYLNSLFPDAFIKLQLPILSPTREVYRRTIFSTFRRKHSVVQQIMLVHITICTAFPQHFHILPALTVPSQSPSVWNVICSPLCQQDPSVQRCITQLLQRFSQLGNSLGLLYTVCKTFKIYYHCLYSNICNTYTRNTQ